MSRVVVIGAGAMGLAAAYRACKNGHQVDLIEAAPEAGGMAGHFDFEGVSIERFYHFICKTDYPTFSMLKELGLEGKMVWRRTTMGFFHGGKLHPWGDPLSLLSLPGVGIIDKIRYGIFAFICVRRNQWPALETESAKSWVIRWCGEANYVRFWKPLFDFKFYEYADDISAAWIWTRIRRIGRSRKSIFEEELGYLEGGSLTLVDGLVAGIEANGGTIHLGNPVQQVTVQDGRVTGVQTANGHFPADAVICTTPTPFVSAMVPELPAEWKARYDAIHNIGVICVIFKLARPVSPHFWVNISEPGIEIPGVVEFSNLRSIGNESIVYVPYYMPVTHEKFSWADEALLTEAFLCLQRLNPALTNKDIVATKIARLRYGQPVCEPGFAAKIPPVQTPIAGLQIADTCFYYPEDRGIAESIRIGCQMAESF
jgi:protoporphyrinogen oxidase